MHKGHLKSICIHRKLDYSGGPYKADNALSHLDNMRSGVSSFSLSESSDWVRPHNRSPQTAALQVLLSSTHCSASDQ